MLENFVMFIEVCSIWLGVIALAVFTGYSILKTSLN